MENSKRSLFFKKAIKIFASVSFFVAFLNMITDLNSAFQFIQKVINLSLPFILNPPIILMIIMCIYGLMSIGIFIYYSILNKIIPKPPLYIASLGLILTISFIVLQFIKSEPNRRFVLVFEEKEPKLDIITDSLISKVHINEVFKLHQINQLDNATIISTISRPEVKWKKQFPNGITFDSPIFSVQEVLSDISNNLVDISTLDYRYEISQFILSKNLIKNEIRIFHEGMLYTEAHNLKTKIQSDIPNLKDINLISLDKEGNNRLIEKNATCIILSSNEYYEKFIAPITSENFKNLIVPNWIIASIEDNKSKTNRYCVTKKFSFDLNQNKNEVWAKLFSLIKSEDEKINSKNYIDNVKFKILNEFMSNNIHPINF